jgi:hypothetical protein
VFRQVMVGRWGEESGSTGRETGRHPSKSWKAWTEVDHLSQAEIAREQPLLRSCADTVRFRGLKRPQELCSQCRYLLREDSLQPRTGKVQESAYFNRQKPVGGIHEIHRH